MEKEDVDKMLTVIAQAPDSQIDTKITNQLKELIGKPIPEMKLGVMKAIDQCVCGALASDAAMMILYNFHEVFLDGKREDFNDEICTWRKDYQ